MRYLTSGLFLVGCVLSSRQAAAHFELLFPPSRAPTEIDNYPCGSKGATRGTVTNLRPGQKITVQWKVGVEHTMPGKWRFAIDDSGQDFPVPGSDTSALPLVMDNLAFTGLGMHEQVVEIPNIQCTNCVFQVIQYTSIETSYTADNFYYQCGDITIGGEPTGTTVGTGATTSTATTTGSSATGTPGATTTGPGSGPSTTTGSSAAAGGGKGATPAPANASGGCSVSAASAKERRGWLAIFALPFLLRGRRQGSRRCRSATTHA